ncbi:MAG TPA: hypothetical protein VFN71_07505 [Methylomirabilota bacterium]|nr:hypothetical protein [Methylomirabilota bacterium]
MTPHAAGALALALAVGLAGCAVVRLPRTEPLQGQSAQRHELERKDCQMEVGYATSYDADHSPVANFIQALFFWSTAGAAVGGTVTGIPRTTAGPATEGLVAGAGAGGIAGTVRGLSGQRRFERGWIACMESRGYRILPREPSAAPEQKATAGQQAENKEPESKPQQ